jgi:hypothetical protein
MNPLKLDPAMMLRAGPGTLPRWTRYVIGLASVITVVAIWLGGQLLADELNWFWGRENFWLPKGVAIVAALAIAVCFAPPSKLSRFLRLAVMLPLIHAGLVLFAWQVWKINCERLAETSDGRAFASWFPFTRATLYGAGALVTLSFLVAKKRDWVHALTTLSLSSLLLVGLWMPVISATTGNADGWWTGVTTVLPHPIRTALLIVIPPLLVATAFTYVSLRRRVPNVKLALGVLFALATACRLNGEAAAMVIYANYVPLLLVALILATSSLGVLAIVTLVRGQLARSKFAARERLVGVVDCADQDAVVALEVASWLRAPRVVQRSFAIATSAGTIPVSGADLIAPLPAATTLLARGETLGIIHGGDAVVVAGHARAGGDPFRTSASPLAGDLAIAPAHVERAGVTSMTLAMWRPCVAYLLIVTAVALPGLAALLS